MALPVAPRGKHGGILFAIAALSPKILLLNNILGDLSVNIYPQDRIAIFIDGANLYSAARALAFDIDFKRLRQEFAGRARLVRAFYYTALLEDQEYSPIRPLVDWLDYNGFAVVTKPAKEFTDSTGRRRVKGNMDIELAIDMLDIAPHIDHAILFSGDGDFRSLVDAMQRKGVRVTVVSTLRSQPPMVADELRRQADQFVDLADLQPLIQRDGPPRNAMQAQAPVPYDNEGPAEVISRGPRSRMG